MDLLWSKNKSLWQHDQLHFIYVCIYNTHRLTTSGSRKLCLLITENYRLHLSLCFKNQCWLFSNLCHVRVFGISLLNATQCMCCILLYNDLKNSKMYRKRVLDIKCIPFLYVWIIICSRKYLVIYAQDMSRNVCRSIIFVRLKT